MANSFYRIGVSFLFSVFFNVYCYSQSYEDFGVWTDIEASKQMSDKLDFCGAISFRTDDNSRHLNQFFYQIGIEYNLFKAFKSGLSYRNRFTFPYSGFEMTHRFIWDLKYILKLKIMDIQIRNRTQFQINDPIINRSRIKTSFDIIKKVDGFGYFELFVQPNAPNSYRLNKHRIAIGLDFKIDKSKKFTISYLRQTEVNRSNPLIFNGILSEFTLKF